MPKSSTPVVKKSNALARARWDAESILEPRLVALVASKIKPDDEDFKCYHIHVSELFVGKYGGKDASQLEKVVDNCMDKKITLRDEKGWSKYHLFTKATFAKENGMLTLQFHPDLKPHYLNLKQYVKYSLAEFLSLPSTYSQRLYEILKSWSDKPAVEIPISELHEMLNTPQSMRKDFHQFHLRVLEKARKDIAECAHFHFAWEAIKTGRSVTSVRFTFARREIITIMEDKAAKDREKQHKRNVKLWNTFFPCWQQRGATCEGGHQADEVCALCFRLRPST